MDIAEKLGTVVRELKAGVSSWDASLHDKLKEVVEAGHVGTHNAIDNRFRRHIKDGYMQADYSALSKQQQEEWRLDFAKDLYHSMTVEKTYCHEWQRIDWTKGKYMSATCVFQNQGGTVHDIEATGEILMSFMQMGPPWILSLIHI